MPRLLCVVSFLGFVALATVPLLGEAARLVRKGEKATATRTPWGAGLVKLWPFTVNQTRPTTRPGESEPESSAKKKASTTSLRAGKDSGSTVCQCICGGRTVWHREIFNGDVEAEKERYCKEDICPGVMVPGLKIESSCSYHADSTEVTGGTVCSCDCGSKRLWSGKMFYGDVVIEKERECLEDICPSHATPGLRSTAKCTFHEDLFAKDEAHSSSKHAFRLLSLGVFSMAISLGSFLVE